MLGSRRRRSLLRLGEAEGAEDFAGGQTAYVLFLLVRQLPKSRGELDRGVGDAERRGHGGIDARDFLEHQHVGNRVQARAAPFFGHEHAAAAEFGEFLDFFGGKTVFAIALLH